MKTIYIKIDVPDDFNEISDFSRIEIKEVSSGNVIYDEVKFTEIILPTEEEIESKANSVTKNHYGLKGFVIGANWAINKMKGE